MEGGEEKPAEERVRLPLQPSAYLLPALYAVCREVYRVGAHTLPSVRLQGVVCEHALTCRLRWQEVLHLLVYDMAERVLALYARLAKEKQKTRVMWLI